MRYSYAPAADLTGMPLDLIWGFIMAGLFLSVLLAGAGILINRWLENRPSRAVEFAPPVPQGREYDFTLSVEERRRELQWIEELMEAPAHGELPAAEPSSSEDPRG